MKKFLIVGALISLLSACGTTNPLRAAETDEQKAFAGYGTFVIYEEGAAKLFQDPSTPDAVKTGLTQADAITKPAADNLLDAAIQITGIKVLLKEGDTTEDKLNIASANLQRWLEEAIPLINKFKGLVKSNTKGATP